MDYKNIDWKKDKTIFIEYLYSLRNEKHREFSKKITPGEFEMIGIPVPILKEIARNILKTHYETFLTIDEEDIYEIYLLKGLVIGGIKDSEKFKRLFSDFIGKIDNWAVCDITISASKTIKKDCEYFFNKCRELLKEKEEFKNRIAFVIFLDYFITDEYVDRVLNTISGFRSDKYYANMALAWLLSVIYIKYPQKARDYLLKNNFDKTVIKYTKRKIKDSYRVSTADKDWLKNVN